MSSAPLMFSLFLLSIFFLIFSVRIMEHRPIEGLDDLTYYPWGRPESTLRRDFVHDAR